ncbi:MAG: hypothetical protein D6812_06595 [Deltaproteobacteria bacterium]|nr:MAG: hypothetical protein D6812_06595 [Deltaproteobacteria bacterium]
MSDSRPTPDPDLPPEPEKEVFEVYALRLRRAKVFQEFTDLSREIERREARLNVNQNPSVNITKLVLEIIEAHPRGIRHKDVLDLVVEAGATDKPANVRTRLRSLVKRGAIRNIGLKNRPIYTINPDFEPPSPQDPIEDPYV